MHACGLLAAMNTGVRIIKRGRDRGLQSLPHGRDERAGRQNEREIARTVKSWIAASAQLRRAEEQRAFALLEQAPS